MSEINLGERHARRSRKRIGAKISNPPSDSTGVTRDISHLVLRQNTRLQNHDDNTVPPVEVFENQATNEKKDAAREAIAERLRGLVVENLQAGYVPHKPKRVLVTHGDPIDNSHLAQLTRVFTYEDSNPRKKDSHRYHLAVFGTIHRPAHSRRIYNPDRIDEWLAEAHLVVMDPHESKEVFASVRFPQAEGETLEFTGPSGIPDRFAELNITRGLLDQIGDQPHYVHSPKPKQPQEAH